MGFGGGGFVVAQSRYWAEMIEPERVLSRFVGEYWEVKCKSESRQCF